MRRHQDTQLGVQHTRCQICPDRVIRFRCISCWKEYLSTNGGTCNKCYFEARETEKKLKRDVDNLKYKVIVLSLSSSLDHGSTDVLLIASQDVTATPIPAHKSVLVSRSPVFKAMFENDTEESRSGIIKISDVSHDALRTFVYYLHTAKASLDEQMACDLLVLSEKCQVKHLKSYCEKFLATKISSE